MQSARRRGPRVRPRRQRAARAIWPTISRLARSAAAAGAQLLVLPQAFLTGPAEDAASVSERACCRTARRCAIWPRSRARGGSRSCAAIWRPAPAAMHDSALFVDHRGCALANYRRTHFDPGGDPDALARGHGSPWCRFAGTQAGRAHRRRHRSAGAGAGPDPGRRRHPAGPAAVTAPSARSLGDAVLPPGRSRTAAPWPTPMAGRGRERHAARSLGPRGELAGRGRRRPRGRRPAAGGDGRRRTPRRAERRPQLYQRLAALPPRGGRAAR